MEKRKWKPADGESQKELIQVFGLREGVMLFNLLYWTANDPKRANQKGEIWKSNIRLDAETGLSRDQNKRARWLLAKTGVISQRVNKQTHQIFIKVNLDMVMRMKGNPELYQEKKRKVMAEKRDKTVRPESTGASHYCVALIPLPESKGAPTREQKCSLPGSTGAPCGKIVPEDKTKDKTKDGTEHVSNSLSEAERIFGMSYLPKQCW